METMLLLAKIMIKSGSTRQNLNLKVLLYFHSDPPTQEQKQSLYDDRICLKKEDDVILTANCTCVAGYLFVLLSFILLHFILKKNKHLKY